MTCSKRGDDGPFICIVKMLQRIVEAML